MADRRLQVFHAVARYGSFTRAAERLFMTQPAVTFQIKQLEEHFNIRLFERGHGKMTLTPAGEVVLDYAQRILHMDEELEARVAEITSSLSGVLKIGTSTTIATYWLPEVLLEFKKKYPEVVPRVVVGNSQLTQDRMVERELDIGFVEMINGEPELDCRVVCQDELVVIVMPDHTLAQYSSLSAQDLQSCPFINRDPGNAVRDITEKFFSEAGIDEKDLPIVAELGGLTGVKRLVTGGCGYAIASRASVIQDIKNGILKAIPMEPRQYTPFTILCPRNRFRSQLITTFVDFAAVILTRMAKRNQGKTAWQK